MLAFFYIIIIQFAPKVKFIGMLFRLVCRVLFYLNPYRNLYWNKIAIDVSRNLLGAIGALDSDILKLVGNVATNIP